MTLSLKSGFPEHFRHHYRGNGSKWSHITMAELNSNLI